MGKTETGKSIDTSLQHMQRITLEKMGAIKLMNRTDTKYVVGAKTLDDILTLAQDEYMVQEIEGEVRQRYSTTYYDTESLSMYNAHHNGRKRREKIRVRTYVGSDLTFLEVKNKNNKGRTDKKRIRLASPLLTDTEEIRSFLGKVAMYARGELMPVIENEFRRITLVNKGMTERLTIDTDIKFSNLIVPNNESIDGIAIIEVKRDGRVDSPMIKILNRLRVKEMGFSKYCIGTAMTNPNARANRFKMPLRQIEKIQKSI